MIAIPAVDLRDGACVQLVGGSYDAERIRIPDARGVARAWSDAGFTRLHVVDLDAATGRGSHGGPSRFSEGRHVIRACRGSRPTPSAPSRGAPSYPRAYHPDPGTLVPGVALGPAEAPELELRPAEEGEEHAEGQRDDVQDEAQDHSQHIEDCADHGVLIPGRCGQ